MTPRFRIGPAGWTLVVAASMLLAGCDDEEPLVLMSMGLGPVPIDSTLPGELPEGTYVAFGFRMPDELRMTQRSPASIQARGSMSFEDLANYVRRHTKGGRIETGPTVTRFREVTAIETGRVVDVDVFKAWQGSRIIVRDMTRKKRPPEPDLTEKQRWERMGLTTDGKVIEKYAQ